MAITIANQIYDFSGSQRMTTARITLDNSYVTGGYTLTAAQLGMSRFTNIVATSADGYSIDFGSFAAQPSSILMPVFSGAAGTTGATSGGTPAAQTFTGTSSLLNASAPVFSGTGQSSSGQVITTTDTQTMASNQCAGMWFVSATHGPYLIASNTAVNGASAVLTIYGTAPTTDAGTYKIVTTIPVGTNGASAALATHTHPVGASGGAQVANGTNLSAVSFEIVAYGY